MKRTKKEPIADRRRKALMEHFHRMDHRLLVSFLNCWLKNSEVKYLCQEEGVKVD
jgi:hypothetical protein